MGRMDDIKDQEDLKKALLYSNKITILYFVCYRS